MANPKWGAKRTCLGCGKRFYDMRREPIICPACGESFEIGAATRTRRPRASVQSGIVPPPPEARADAEGTVEDEAPDLQAAEAEEADDIVAIEEKDAETIEDPSELGEDEDDMAEVIDGMEETKKADV